MAKIEDIYNAVNTDCYVATDGKAGGNGNIASPLSWASAKLLYDTLWPGVTLKFRGGTYSIDEFVGFSGNPRGEIKLSAADGEIVKINGSLWMEQDYCILQDMEIYDADFINRATLQGGSFPSNIPAKDGARAENNNVRLIGLIIHDTRQGIITGSGKTNLEISDCLIYYNGWSAPDRGHGHGIYSGTIKIKNCVVFENFGYGLHGYMGGPNIIYEDCIVFDNGELNNFPQCNILVGGTAIAADFQVNNCQTYFRRPESGIEQFIGLGNGGVIKNNTFVALTIRIDVANTDVLIEGNKFYGNLMNFSSDDYPNNIYRTLRPKSGFDVFVHPSENYKKRAYVAIYNWSGANALNVDVSTIFGKSGTVKARNVQDYFVDIQTLTITAGVIMINMQAANRTVATPIGWTAPATTFPQFGAFVLEKA